MRLSDRIEQDGITTSSLYNGRTRDADGWEHDAWTVTLAHGSDRWEVPFRKGLGHDRKPPTAQEVLTAVLSDAAGVENAQSFEDWASEYGYDTDSRRAEAIYTATVRQTGELREFLGDHFGAYVWETEED